MSFNVQTDIDNHTYPVITTPFKSDVDTKSLTTFELPTKDYTYKEVLHINSTLSYCYYKLKDRLSRNVVFQIQLEENTHEYEDSESRARDSYRRLCIIPDVPLSMDLCVEITRLLNQEFNKDISSFVLYTPILSDNTTAKHYKDIISMLLCVKKFPEIVDVEYDDELFFKDYIKCMEYRDDCLWLKSSTLSYADYARLSIIVSMYIEHMISHGYAAFEVEDISLYDNSGEMSKINNVIKDDTNKQQASPRKRRTLLSRKRTILRDDNKYRDSIDDSSTDSSIESDDSSMSSIDSVSSTNYTNRTSRRTRSSEAKSRSLLQEQSMLDNNILTRWNCELIAINKNDRKILVRPKWNDENLCQIMRMASLDNGFTRITVPFRSDVHAHYMALYCQRNNINFIVLGNLFYIKIRDYNSYKMVTRSLYNINNEDIKSQYIFRIYVDHENIYKQAIRNNTKYNSVIVYKSIESLKYKTIMLVGSAIYTENNIPTQKDLLNTYNEITEQNEKYENVEHDVIVNRM